MEINVSNFLKLLSESFPKSVSDILNNEKTDSQTKSAELNWHPELDDVARGTGSSRHYWEMPNKHTITLDGKKTDIRHGLKMAVKSHLDDFHDGEMLGKQQNKEESHEKYENFRVINKEKDGSYKTNNNGVLAPIFDKDKKGNWMHVGHVSTYSTDPKGFEDHIKQTTPPDFKHKKPDLDDIIIALKDHEDKHHSDLYTMSDRNKEIVEKHPFAKKLAHLIDTTGITSHDLHSKNLGMFHHPITGEKMPVVLDYGATKDLLGSYTDASDNERNKIKVRTLKESVLSEMHQSIDSLLSQKMDIHDKNDMLNDYIGHLKKSRISSGIKKITEGGSRNYISHNNTYHINLDGKPIKIKYGTKLAKNEDGVSQNEHESSDQYKKFHTYTKDNLGNYHTNPNGVLATVLGNDKNHHWNEMEHISPFSAKAFKEFTKSAYTPHGIDFDEMIKHIENVRHNSFSSNKLPENENISRHPLTKKLVMLVSSTNIDPRDLRYKFNWGTHTHPITKERKPVILDYGLNKKA